MVYSVILLAGNSERINSQIQKQYFLVNNKEVFLYSFETFYRNNKVDKIILVCNSEKLEFVKEKIKRFKNKKIFVIEGGTTRRDSCYNALSFIKKNEKDLAKIKVLIHDAARPLVTTKIINDCLAKLKTENAVVPVINQFDSTCEVKNNKIISYLQRENILSIQTPQCFDFKLILDAHEKNKNALVNDDGELVKLLGKKLSYVEGDWMNFKITTFDQLMVFKRIVEV